MKTLQSLLKDQGMTQDLLHRKLILAGSELTPRQVHRIIKMESRPRDKTYTLLKNIVGSDFEIKESRYETSKTKEEA